MKNSFSSKIGLLLAAAGSAIGLGSIWKFPYIVGEDGGGAFIIIYIICSFIFGLPLVMNEFLIGKLSRKSAYGAFRTLSGTGHWQWLSWLTLSTVMILQSFYFVVTGWCFYYMVEAASNTFAGMDANALTAYFDTFSGNISAMTVYAVIAIALTGAVLWFDVNKGIERLSKILMPLLFIMLIVMAIHMVMLDGGGTGLRFLFEPNFSKITPKIILEAMGLSFFTLSIGVGALITYGGYMPKDQNVTTASLQMIVLVILVSLLAGTIVFPAVFAYGFSPTQGPELTFITLPEVFQHMFSPTLTSVSFFALMCVAALTSTISMMEVPVAFFCIDVATYTLADHLQLFDGCRTIDVTSHQQRLLVLLGLQHVRQFSCERRLTRTLQARHQDDGRAVFQVQLYGLAAHQLRQFVVYNLHHQLARLYGRQHVHAQGFLLDGIRKLLGHLVVHVGIQQCAANVLHGFRHIDFGDFSLTFQYLERPFKSF